MADFLQSWEDRVPLGVTLTEAEESAVIVFSELLGVSRSVIYDGITYAALAHRYKEIYHQAEERVFQSPGPETSEDRAGAEAQIELLAAFIMKCVPGEPSRGNEGAGDCAVRIIQELQADVKQLRAIVKDQEISG